MEQVCSIDTRLGREFGAAASGAIERLPQGQQPELVVSHGQTVFHWIEDGRASGTLQLGQPAWIAEATGLPVISDVRIADIAAGGHGAPLSSILDVLLFGGGTYPVAALNLGGIANVTVAPGVDDQRKPRAFDTGPANALLDASMRRATNGRESVDRDGQAAARGTVNQHLLEALLDEPYYALPAPKSTGKELFNVAYLENVLARTGTGDIGLNDLLATQVELVALTVTDALAPHKVRTVVASGGGIRNRALMDRLATRLGPTALETSDAYGLDPGAKEGFLFALIGFLTWHGLPGTLPDTTGARHCTVAGRITPGAKPLRLPEPAEQMPASLRILIGPA